MLKRNTRATVWGSFSEHWEWFENRWSNFCALFKETFSKLKSLFWPYFSKLLYDFYISLSLLKAPLYNQYPLPETKTIENPAIWNDIHIQSYPESLQNGTLRTHADAFDDHTVPRINHKKEYVYTSHDPRKHRSNR